MAGYSRQSAADIIANAVIKAAPVNAEYNALRDAFLLSGGHKHDGSSTEGGYVPLIADSDALNKVVIDTSNNRIGFFSEVSSAAVEQIRIQDGAILPVTDDDIDLGTSALKFKDLYIDGIGYFDSVDINGGSIDGASIGGSSAAAGSFTTIGASGAVTLASTLAVTGTSSFTGAATITSADINSGTMDNTTIGNATPAAGTFTDLTTSGTSTHATVDINGGAIDGVTIGASSAGAGTFTNLTASGTTTVTTADINGGNIDGTIIGASSAAAGSFTTVSTSGQATLATVDINGGAIDGAIIGASSAAAITGTTITASSGFVGDLTGNITGDIDGDITGNITGNVTGNVTANSGTSTFANVTVNGTLDVTGTTIANVTDPSNAQDAATKNYVDTEVSALVDSAPGTLNTLNELAAALGDDASFSTTITNSIATKLPLAGGTMSGAIAMGTAKITGLGDPTANQDAATKKYTTDTFLPLAGGTLTGAVAAGNNKITASYTPSAGADLTTKTYVDGILSSGTAAATSATAAASSATAAASSATAAASSATGAASSATSAAASFDSFDDRYLGAKSSAPSVDNDGDALQVGTLYFNTTTNSMQVYGGSGFTAAGSSVNGTSSRNTYTATAGQTSFAATYDSGFVDVYLNGVKLLAGTDFTATNGTSVVLASGAAVNDIVDIVAYGTFTLATHYTKTESDALLAAKQPYATIAVTVVNSGGNKYALDGTVQQLAQLRPSITYRFDQSDSSNSGHPLRLSTTSNGTHGGGSAFTTGVTAVGTPGSAGAYTEVKLEQDAPNTLYYYCTNHSGMGGEVDVNAKLPLSGGTLTGGLTGTTATFTGDVTIADKIVHSGDTNTAIRFPAVDTFAVETDGSERLRVTSTGNVGIATNSPSTFSNYTNVTLQGGSAGVNLDFKDSGGNRTHAIVSTPTEFIVETGNTDPLIFKTNNSEALRIDSSGNLGLATSDISGFGGTYKGLDVAYKGSGLAGRTDNPTFDMRSNLFYDGSNYKYGEGSTTAGILSVGGAQLIFSNAPSGTAGATATVTERMRMDDSGNLLVGKTTIATSTAGVALRSNGEVRGTVSGAEAARFSRLSSDGAIIGFEKDGSGVGTIGAVNGNIKVSAYGEEYASLSGTSVTISCTAGNNFALTTSGNTTFTFSNVPTSGTAFGFTLKLTSGGSHTITYPNSVDFAGATAPDAPASGETDILVFYTVDGGTNWYGALAIDAAG